MMHSVPYYSPAVQGKREKRVSVKLWITWIRARINKRFFACAMCFFLFSLAQCFSVPSPYAVCFLTALLYTGIKPVGAVPGLLCGIAFRYLWGADPDLPQYMACFLSYFLLLMPKLKRKQMLLFTSILLIVRSLPGILRAADTKTMILHGSSVLIGLISMPALEKAARMIRDRKREWSEDDGLCVMLPVLLLICGASRLTVFQMNIGYGIADLLTLLFAWAAGVGPGVCLGLGCGLALMLGSQGAAMLIGLSFGGLFAGIMTGKNRLWTALIYMIGVAVINFLAMFAFQKELILPACTGALVFCLIPGKQMKKMLRLIRRIRWNQPRENLCSRIRMQRWVNAVQNIAGALPSSRITPATAEEECEEIAEKLCDQCERLPICWRDHYEETKKSLEILANRKTSGADDPLPLINQRFSACPRMGRLPDILYSLDQKQQDRLIRSVCADYETEMLQTHLTALSQAAQKMDADDAPVNEEESYWLSQIEDALQSARFPGHAAFAKKIDGRMMICIQYEPLSLRPAMGENLIRHIGLNVGVSLEVTEQKAGQIILEEEPVLCVYTGIATACAITPERKLKVGKRADNGDAVMVRNLSGGRKLLALSDGMGHGAGAQDESRKTLELLSLCMDAGYSHDQAMTAVNGAMLTVTGGEKFATVDLCTVNLWNGQAYLNKLGACMSVLIQGQKIRMLSGEALPLGIIEKVTPTKHSFSFCEGDLLLLMSDGITDAFPCEDEIICLLKRVRNDTPQHIADALLQEAIIQQDGLPRDDMTVLCAQIAQRHPQKNARRMIQAG